MQRRMMSGLVIAMVGMFVATMASEAEAWYGGSCGSWGYRHGSWGSYGSGGWYGRQYGSWGSYGGGWYHAGNYLTVGHRTYYANNRNYRSPSVRYIAKKRPVVSRGVAIAAMPQETGRAKLAVNVPRDAEVFVNGRKTQSVGTRRVFSTREMSANQAAEFTVRAVLPGTSGSSQQTQVVTVKSGQVRELTFASETPKVVETALTLLVPSDATVHIDGRRLDAAGSQRTVKTRRLAVGQQSKELQVRVTVERDGREHTEEQTIALRGGEHHSLRFELNDAQLARR